MASRHCSRSLTVRPAIQIDGRWQGIHDHLTGITSTSPKGLQHNCSDRSDVVALAPYGKSHCRRPRAVLANRGPVSA